MHPLNKIYKSSLNKIFGVVMATKKITKKAKKGKAPKILTKKQKLMQKIERIKKHLKKSKEDKQSMHRLKMFEAQLH